MATPQDLATPLERPQLTRASSAASSYREGRRTPIQYQHHEPVPKRLFRKIAHLVQSKDREGRSHARRDRAGSTASALRPSPAPAVLVDEPSSIVVEPAHVNDVRPNLKIRIATFNMADNLPAPGGDLSEFLGDLSTFPEAHLRRSRSRRKRSSSGASALFSRGRDKATSVSSHASAFADEPTLPRFPLTADHPYHIIVVCGQECPTARSGGVFRGQSWTSLLENYLCGGADASESSDEDSDIEQDDPDVSRDVEHSLRTSIADTNDTSLDEERSSTAPCTDDERSAAASVEETPSHRPPSAADTASISSRTSRRGPYILVEKERLMGIYCAVFVARCCEEFVDGVSKSRVTAGLIGGRVGNKGGVGISLQFASCRLLFVSAHLAAHASGLDIRKANAQKILDELEVDDFLETVGPKPKRLVDRFDQVFFVGDLNFRLNISRLHADWLVQARDFANALQFDQLRAVLAEPECALSGFGEAPIAFGPTYKYDLRKMPRKLTRKRSILLHPRHHHKAKSVPPVKPAASARFPYLDSAAVSSSLSQLDGVAVAESPDDDTASIASTIDVEALDALVAENSELLASPQVADAIDADPVRNARVRFLTLVKRNSTLAALETARLRAQASRGRPQNNGQRIALSDLFNEKQAPKSLSTPPPRPILRQSQSTLTPRNAGIDDGTLDIDAEEAQDEPAWDSSKKQRVQSWTDRILFYPNRKPDVDSEENIAEGASSPNLAPAILANDCPAPSALAPTRSRSVYSLPSDRNKRSKSKIRLYRHASRDDSSDALGSAQANLWQRVKSFPVLAVLDRRLSSESRSPSPTDGDPDCSLPEPIQSPPPPGLAPQASSFRRAPRRHFTLSADSPQSSPSSSPAHSPATLVVTTDPVAERVAMPPAAEKPGYTDVGLPRAKTFASALNRLHDRASEAGHGSSSRLRTFLTSLPVALPFLSTPVHDPELGQTNGNRDKGRQRLVGPLPGEVLPIKYDSIMNIDRMGAVSDHRPVYLVCAVGVETK